MNQPDLAAIARHGIGRGDYAALVFSGSVDALGEVAGSATWSTACRFALEDPRLSRADCLARREGSPFAHWTNPIEPTPGVCFVLSDAEHPGAATLRSRGGIEFEHYATLDRLTTDALVDAQLHAFLSGMRGESGGAQSTKPRGVVLLGYGDQGQRLAARVSAFGCTVFVVDAQPTRAEQAQRAGYTVIAPEDVLKHSLPIISTPLRRPVAFDSLLSSAREAGLPVLDNAQPWTLAREHAASDEFRTHGRVHLAAAADRICTVDKLRLSRTPGAPAVTLHAIRLDRRTFGETRVPHLHAGQRINLSESVDLHDPSPTDRLPGLFARADQAFIGIDGQSNQHDAALGVFAAREVLARLWPEEVRTLMPSDHRAALGANPFERLLARSITGRTLGAPYLSPIEQTTLGILAWVFSYDSPIIEIGSALGGSALLMAAATERLTGGGPGILSIDPDGDTRPAMRTLFRHEGLGSRLGILEKTSDEAVEDAGDFLKGRRLFGVDADDRIILMPPPRVPAQVPGRPTMTHDRAGVLFIDGLHTFEQARRDIQNYAPLIRPGGVLLMHDFDARFAGVARTITEIIAPNPRFTPIAIMDTIAVFQRR